MKTKSLVVITLSLLLAACVSPGIAPRYSASADNLNTLRATKASMVSVGKFEGSQTTPLVCRGGQDIIAPDNLTYEAYLQKALQDEIKVAGIYGVGGVTLTGSLDSIDFDSYSGKSGGSWNIAATIKSSNGRSTSKSVNYIFVTGFEGASACKNVADALSPAIQDLLSKFFTDDKFPALLSP